jgi:hypothetical protein
MPGEIKHEWNGTVLTITSDSGTSSADLKGAEGERGIRGPQGRAGVILKEDGSVDMNGYATEAYVIDAIEVALEDYTPSGGGGGGGGTSSNNAVMTLKSTTGWTFKTISGDVECLVSGEWSSIEEDLETGNGTLTVYVNNLIKINKNVPQGEFSLDVAPHLSSGNNTVKVKITDIYGNVRTVAYTVSKISLTLTSSFDATTTYKEDVSFPYVATGSLTKTMHFVLDGTEIGTQEVTTSGRQQTFTIAKQSHGAHLLDVYFTADIEGETVESNHLFYDIMFIESGNAVPIVACSYQDGEMEQFETINIPYIVYSPASMNSSVILAVNGETVGDLVVNRTQQIWAYRADTYGEVVLTITCGGTVKTITLDVEQSNIDVEETVDSLELHLSSYGRNNNEDNPASWDYDNIACEFTDYNWVSDGWQLDDEGITVHRVSGDARLTIPLKMFETDFKTSGKTIEFEFQTRDVSNYDAEIISCFSGNSGFKLTAQKAILQSEQSEISTQYKDSEHIRVSFVVEKKTENRLILIYLNGIMCGAVQYPTDDNFAQSTPVNITIGSNDCTIDLYNIRIYKNSLTRYQIVDNWIYDTQNITLKADRYARNHIYDDYGKIVIENLPSNLPYMILTGPELPQYKGNKLSIDGEFVDPIHSNKSFKFTDAEIDVQGTSSAGYARKNYTLKLTNGLTQNGSRKTTYQMRNDSVPTNCFCFKADVASSEGCNNVELARLYDAVSPYRTPPQITNKSIRQGIDGFPMVIFHNDGEKTTFIGKYNFNNEKSTHEVFGLTTGDESWETKNNTSNRVIWKNADFSGVDWQNDFEARYPKNNTNVRNLANFASWVASTDRTQATNAELVSAVTYNGITYTTDNADYRLAKFRNEIYDYAELESALFYYLFTELFLMVDSRAKNTFPSYIGGDKLCWLPYDMDTAIGINNEGALAYGYSLEDTDTTESGANVYNGQDSVFWCNLRDSFGTELRNMYYALRSGNKISYDIIEDSYEEHQSVWPEAIWNEDAYYKYLEPLIEDGAGIYLPMLQGSKSEQRKWWMYNRFRYIDSKYNAGDSLKDFITLRGYAKSDITITPFADIYSAIKYGSYLVQNRALRGNDYTLACPLDTLNDTEIYIYSASQLADIGDLSGLKVGLADFSMATKLQHIKVGDADANYSNGNLNSLTLGNNKLLKTLDARNCTAFGTGEQQSLDLSGCTQLEEVYLTGTAIKGVSLPNGGVLKTLHLPDTMTNLTVINQPALREFVLNNPSNIATLWLENVDEVISAQSIVDVMNDGGRVRLINVNMTLTGVEIATEFFDKLNTMHGIDESGNNVATAQISGRIRVTEDCAGYISEWQAKYPDITFEIWTPNINEMSWTQIARMGEAGTIQQFFPVGTERTITLSTGEVVTLVILGFNHDDLPDNAGKASITFGVKECTEITSSASFSYTGYGIADGNFHLAILSYFDLLPSDLQSVIKPVRKWYDYHYSTSRGWTFNSSYVDDKVFAFSNREIMGVDISADYGKGASDDNGTQYEYFTMAPIPEGGTPAITGATTGTYKISGIAYNAYAIKGLGADGDPKIAYKTRSMNSSSSYYTSRQAVAPFVIQADGSSTNNGSSGLGVTFGFCI